MVDDNPADPLGQPKIVKGEPTKPGAYPWQAIIELFYKSCRLKTKFSSS
jgi:hypothetical protein